MLLENASRVKEQSNNSGEDICFFLVAVNARGTRVAYHWVFVSRVDAGFRPKVGKRGGTW